MDEGKWLDVAMWAYGGTVGAFLGEFYWLAGKISQNTKELHTKVEAVKDDYVSQESLDRQLKGIERQLGDIREDGRQPGDQLQAIMDRIIERG